MTNKNIKQTNEEVENGSILCADEEYWKQYATKRRGFSGKNHNISIDIAIKFKDYTNVIYESKEQNINCNLEELEGFFNRLKKTIRMIDINKIEEKEESLF